MDVREKSDKQIPIPAPTITNYILGQLTFFKFLFSPEN